MNEFELTQSLLRQRAELRSRLNLLPYDGTPEVKELSNGKYLYIRKRSLGKLTSTYVGPYTDDLYNLLIRNANDAKSLKKSIRNIDKELAKLGYSEEDVADIVANSYDIVHEIVEKYFKEKM